MYQIGDFSWAGWDGRQYNSQHEIYSMWFLSTTIGYDTNVLA